MPSLDVLDTAAPTPDAPPGVRRRSPALAFGALLILTLLLRLACMTGLIGSDDLDYARYAQALAEGQYTQTLIESRAVGKIHHGLRYGVVVPVAAVYKVFGVSEWSTVVLPLLASTLSVLLLAEVGRRLFGLRVGILAGVLYATFPLQLILGTVLLPEVIVACFVLGGVLAYVAARERGGVRWLAAGVLIGLAYLAKEPALFAGGALFLHGLWERRYKGALLLALGMAIVGASELGYHAAAHGDPLFRVHSTQVFDLHAPDNQSTINANLGYRLLKKYPRQMLVPSPLFGLHSLVALVLAAWALTLRPRRGYMLVVLWAVVPFLYLNFGSWSFERYSPLPRDPRYLELVYPPLFLLAAVVLARALAARRAVAVAATSLFAIVVVTGVACGLDQRGRTAGAPEMSVLKEIARTAHERGQRVYTEDKDWRRALVIIDAGVLSAEPSPDGLVVVRGPLGLPAVQRAGPAHQEGRQ